MDYVISASYGNDSMAMIRWAYEHGLKNVVVAYCDTGWATPELEIDGETIECYRIQSETPGWDSGTYWPDEALAILTPNA